MFELISTVIRENALAGILPGYIVEMTVTPDMSLSDLGVDSLGRLTVMYEICDRLGIPQIDVAMDDDVTLAKFGQLLLTALSQSQGTAQLLDQAA